MGHEPLRHTLTPTRSARLPYEERWVYTVSEAKDSSLIRVGAAGALACTHPGDWEGAPTRADLGALYEDPVSR